MINSDDDLDFCKRALHCIYDILIDEQEVYLMIS